MAAKGAQKSGETLQIVILTLFMTAGFFALFSLVLSFLIPGREEAVNAQIKDLRTLRTELQKNGELWKLRAQVATLEASAGDDDDNLRTILYKQLLDIEAKGMPATKVSKVSQSSSTEEHMQHLDFDGVSTQSLLNYVARVKQKRDSIRLASVTMRNRGSGEAPDWSGKLVFKYFVNPELQAKIQAKARRKDGGADAEASAADDAPPPTESEPADEPADEPAAEESESETETETE